MGTHKKNKKQANSIHMSWRVAKGRRKKNRGKKLHIFKFYLRVEQKKNFHLFSSAICGKICARRKKFFAPPTALFSETRLHM